MRLRQPTDRADIRVLGPDRNRHNYARLTEVKAKYDPNNLFKVNQNIRPRADGAGNRA